MLTQKPHSRVVSKNIKKRRRPKCLAQRFYEFWIKENLERFKHPPYIVRSAPDYFVLRFKGVAPEITCRIGKHGRAEVLVRDSSGVYWDIITDLTSPYSVIRRGNIIADCANPNIGPISPLGRRCGKNTSLKK